MSGDSFQIAVFETLFLLVSIFAAALLLGGRVRWIWLVPIPVVAFLGKLIFIFWCSRHAWELDWWQLQLGR